MQRFSTHFARNLRVVSQQRPGLGAIRTRTDHLSVESNPEPQKKNYEDAKSTAAQKDKDLSEGHSLDRSGQASTFQDVHTQQVSKAQEERKGNDDSGSDLDAVNLSSGKNTGQAEQQRKAHATPMSDFQPGQKGDQVGSGSAENPGKQANEGKVGQKKAPKNTTLGGMGEFAKNVVGKGPASGFHTYARARYASVATPESAVDKGARKPKDKAVKGAQNAHLPHHAEGEGDKMPAVKDSASLPSKKGDASHGKKQKADSSAPASSGHAGSGIGGFNNPGSRATGTAKTPGSRAVDPSSATHSPSFAPHSGPQAAYTHVVGSPDPDSRQTGYAYSTKTESGGIPSGTAPRSSTSSSPYPEHTTAGILKNEAGVGSSNEMITDTLKGADEMVAKQEKSLGGAGDDVGGRGQGGQSYRPPPDFGEKIEDTLPKPIKN